MYLSFIVCITLIFSVVYVINNMYVYAEENINETTEFETLEKQILDSERWCSTENGALDVSLDIKNMWFLPNEDIVVSYLASNEQEITNFDYEATGFEVVNIGIDNDNGSRITTELNCLPDEEEYMLNISVTVSGEDIDVSMYAISNEYGTFISQFSTANEYERYLEYAVTENIVTLEQAEEMWYAFLESDDENALNEDEISMENIDSGVAPASTGRGTVCGYLKWKERGDGDLHPLRGIKVEIYYKLLGVGIKLATTYTRDDGYYSVDIDAHDNVYIKIYAGDGNITVGSGIFGWPYSIKFDAEEYQCNVSSGETVMINTPDLSMKSDEEPKIKEEVKHAFQIAQAAIAARDYAYDMMTQNVTDVTIIYPSLPAIGTCYIPVLSCIAIDGVSDIQEGLYSYEAWDVIMHEYGHHIEFLLNIMMDPYVDIHYSYVNHADDMGTEKGTRLAWGESWNTVFGLMAQDYLISKNKLDNNIKTVGDEYYTSYKSTQGTNIELYAQRKGEACEQSIMGVLWDLYDSNNEGKDEITLTHQEYWDLTTVAWTYRFSARANRFYELYSDEPEKIKAFAEILTYYKMAPSCPTLHNSADVSVTLAPSLSWTAEGGSTEYPNNSFDIVVYDTSYNEIIRVENIENTYYEFNDANWQYALENHGYPCAEEFKIYITVAGSRKEPLLLDPNFSTGPYYSEYLEMSVKTEHNIVYEQVDTNTHKYICHTCDEETTLEHNFEYTSNGDTGHTKACVECGYYETSNHVLRYESQNNLYHNEYCRYCDYKRLLVSHNYTNRYEYYDSENHYGYCLCGVKILQKHSFSTSGNLDICTYCKIEKDHVHSYTYRPAIKGKTHIKECRCGEKNTEACFGAAIFGEPAYCGRCGEEMKFGGIGILSNENEDALLPNDDEEYLEQ